MTPDGRRVLAALPAVGLIGRIVGAAPAPASNDPQRMIVIAMPNRL